MSFEAKAATMSKQDVAAVLASKAFLESENSALKTDKVSLQSKITKLESQLSWYQKQVFGKKSERSVPEEPSEQAKLFEVAKNPAPEKKIPIKEHTRSVSKVLKTDEEEAPEGTFPEHLRREEKIIDEKPKGYRDSELEELQDKVTERLAEEPGEQYVKVYRRKVYKIKKTGEIKAPPAPEHLFGRCKVDETFLILMIIKKFLWHLPLYRQHQMLKLDGINLSRESFASWAIKLSELFNPIAKALKRELFKQNYLHVDNTPGKVGKGKKKKGKKYSQGYFWPLLNPDIGVYFEYSSTKAYKAFEKLIDPYAGTLVSDAEEIFEKYTKAHELSWQLCWMHIRRNFYKAEASSPELAAEALSYIRALYDVEREIKHQDLKDPEKISLFRQKHSKPILDEFKDWLKRTSATPEGITDDLLSKAIHYVYSRWDAAVLYLYDGSLPMDNGADERELRPLKLGLKNYLFCASETGAEAAAVFYTLIHSAKMHGIHPYYYLLDLCKRIEQPGLIAEDLVPHKWKERFFEEAVPEKARHVLTEKKAA